MATFKSCPSCGVPRTIARVHDWNSDGTITQKRDPDHRLVFMECDGVNAIFSEIERLIGIPIEKIVIESKARATTEYIKHLVRGPVKYLVRIIGTDRMIRKVLDQARALGYGAGTVTEYSLKENYLYLEVGHPYSLPLICGDIKGSDEAFRDLGGTVTHEEIGPDRYLLKNYASPHAPALKERLLPHPKPRKPGDVTYDRCGRCGVPKEMSFNRWDMEKGIITNPDTGLRMAVFGPAGLAVVFEELERELGDAVPEIIIDAHRAFTAKAVSPSLKGLDQSTLRRWLSVRGMGNLVSLEEEEGSYEARIENPALPLILVGTAVAFFEYSTGTTGSVNWNISGDGDLTVRVSPASAT